MNDMSLSGLWFLLPSFLILSHLAAAFCECGYSINATTDPSSHVFTDLFETDFLHFREDDWDKDSGWIRQEYSVPRALSRGPFGKQASLGNVLANPLRDRKGWTGPGVREHDAGLQLWVREAGSAFVGMAEVASERLDMLYGSFRVGMKLTALPGTCGAFFWYRSNSQEVDVEFLSRQFSNTTSPINLVVQTPESAQRGFDAQGTPTFRALALPFAPAAGTHEYRFDWTPGRIRFLADGAPLADMTHDIPDGPGHLSLNHWSNGDPLWSGGPPEADAVITVSYVKAYFNSSDPARRKAHAKACADDLSVEEWRKRVCQIPDQRIPPDGKDAKTYFFTNDEKHAPHQVVYDVNRFPDAAVSGKVRARRAAQRAAVSAVVATVLCPGVIWCLVG